MGGSRTVVTDVWIAYAEVISRFSELLLARENELILSCCSSFSTTVLFRIACVAGVPSSPFNAFYAGYIQD